MRNAKRLLAALLLAAALILSSASCGGQTETASEAPAAASSEPQRDYTVQISKDTLRRTGLDITAAAHRLGLTNVTTNDDGSCIGEADIFKCNSCIASYFLCSAAFCRVVHGCRNRQYAGDTLCTGNGFV